MHRMLSAILTAILVSTLTFTGSYRADVSAAPSSTDENIAQESSTVVIVFYDRRHHFIYKSEPLAGYSEEEVARISHELLVGEVLPRLNGTVKQ